MPTTIASSRARSFNCSAAYPLSTITPVRARSSGFSRLHPTPRSPASRSTPFPRITFRGALGLALAEALESHRGTLASLPFAALCDAARFANAAAALCVTRPGAAPAIPARPEIDALLQETAHLSQAAS